MASNLTCDALTTLLKVTGDVTYSRCNQQTERDSDLCHYHGKVERGLIEPGVNVVSIESEGRWIISPRQS